MAVFPFHTLGDLKDGFNVLVIVSVLLVGYLTYNYVLRRREYEADMIYAAQHGCQPMEAAYPTKWPLGLDVLKAQYINASNKRLFAFQQPHIDELGSNWTMSLLGSTGYTTLDPDNIESILSSSFEDWGMGSRRNALLPFIGEGIFVQDGPAWKHSREMLRRPFLKAHYQDLKAFNQHVGTLISKISSSTGVVDLQPHFYNFTLATTTALLFGQTAKNIADEDQDTFAKRFDYASWVSSWRIRLQDFYWAWNTKKYRASCQTVKDFAGGFVKRALEETDKEKAEETSTGYEFIRDLYSELKDPVLVRDQLVNVLLAGRDTTACLLSWTFFLLVRHPSTLSRLRQELNSIIGSSQEVTRAHIQRMSYLRCVLNETLRLYPSVPINVRIAQKRTTIPRGGGPDGASPVLIRKGNGIGYLPYYLHRRKDLYGQDAMEFRPERWENGKLDSIGWAYIPFHAGPRVCLGKDFALMEASCAVVRILQTFPNLRLPPDEEIVPIGQEKQNLTIFLASADGCKVLLQ